MIQSITIVFAVALAAAGLCVLYRELADKPEPSRISPPVVAKKRKRNGPKLLKFDKFRRRK